MGRHKKLVHIARLPTHVEMRMEGGHTLYAEGAAKLVWMDMATGKSAPLPDHVRTILEAG